jgi:hypothetical protein
LTSLRQKSMDVTSALRHRARSQNRVYKGQGGFKRLIRKALSDCWGSLFPTDIQRTQLE